MLVKPVCVKCKCFYRPEKNGYAFIEGMPNKQGHHAEAYRGNIRGTRHPEAWKPYKLWMGDLWKCPDCLHELVVGVIGGPISEHYMSDFKSKVERFGGAQLQVNDC